MWSKTLDNAYLWALMIIDILLYSFDCPSTIATVLTQNITIYIVVLIFFRLDTCVLTVVFSKGLIVQVDMADDADMESVEETTEPSMDSSRGATEENEEGNAVMYKLHEEIDNLNLVLDHLERKNGDIYTRIKQLLASFQQNKTEGDDDDDEDDE